MAPSCSSSPTRAGRTSPAAMRTPPPRGSSPRAPERRRSRSSVHSESSFCWRCARSPTPGTRARSKGPARRWPRHAGRCTGSWPTRVTKALSNVQRQVSATSEGNHRGAGTPGAAISVQGLVKRFGELEAVRGVDFEVATGEVFGFLGPNGAGKTTTINMLCTLAKPTAGAASVAGHDVVRERDDVRRHIGLVFQDPTLDGYLTAAQNLKLHAELYGVQSDLVAPRMRQVMTMVGLWERRDAPVATFSGGMRRRLEIARGLMHSPRVLFLDEPTIGLDPQTRRSIWSYIRELKQREEITIFMTTHYMDEAEWCDRIAIMDHGKIVALDAPETLKAGVGTDRVTIQTDDDDATIAALADRFDIDARK